jgi:hypothetical protein
MDILLLTLAAQAMTLPVLAHHFRSVSLSALLANFLVLPAQPALMVLGLAAVELGIVWLPLGGIFGWLASLVAAYTNGMVSLLAKIPGTISLPQVSLWAVIAAYALLFGWLWLYPKHPHKLVQGSLIAGLVLASSAAWSAGLRISDDRLRIRILSTADHPVLMLQTPKGGWLMLNGMEDLVEFQRAVQQFLPAFNRHLDALLITTSKEEVISSIHAAIADFPVTTILWGLNGQGNSETRWLESDLHQLGTTSQLMQTGNTFDLDGVTIQAADIGKTARSLAIRYGNFELILPEGLPVKDIRGNVPSTSLVWLGETQSLDPDLAAWTVDQPRLILSSAAPPAGWERWETLEKGDWIEFVTDGRKLWIKPSH